MGEDLGNDLVNLPFKKQWLLSEKGAASWWQSTVNKAINRSLYLQFSVWLSDKVDFWVVNDAKEMGNKC